MSEDDVKALAEKLGEVEVIRPFKKPSKVYYVLSPFELKALARVALEFCEEWVRRRAAEKLKELGAGLGPREHFDCERKCTVIPEEPK